MNQETSRPSDGINFEYEFKDTLSFISEICEVPFVFITHLDSSDTLAITKMGFDSLAIPEEILLYNQSVIEQNTVITISDLKKDSKQQSSNSNVVESGFCFFVGLPICDDQNLVIGSICVVDCNAKELSISQIRSLEYAAQQISFKLESIEQNKVQLNKIIEKERQFELFVDNSKEITYEIDLDGVFISMSKNWTVYLGYEIEEAIGKNFALFIHPDDIEVCMIHFNRIVETRNSDEELVYRVLHKDGHYTWHSANIIFLEKEGKPVFSGNCRDITKYVEAKQEIIKQKEFYEKILDQIPTDVAVFDQDHRYLYLNKAAINNNELRKFIIGKDDFEYAKHTGRDDSAAKYRRAKFLQTLESKNVLQWEECVISPFTGFTSYHDRKLNPVFQKDGTLEMMVGFGVNITESKKTQEEILQSKQLLSSILENVAVGVVIHGPQSEILKINVAACEMLGATNDQMIGIKLYGLDWEVVRLDGSDFPIEEHPVLQAIESLKPVYNVIMGVPRPISNDMIWLLVDAIPVVDDLGKLLHVICSFKDITEVKRIEDELLKSNERFTYASQATSDAIWDWNITTDEITIGSKHFDIFGYDFKNNTYLNSELENFIHPDDKERFVTNSNNAIENKAIFKWSDEYRYLKADGTYAYVSDKAIIIRDDQGKAIRMIGAMQDITNRKKLEDDLRQSEAQFKGAFENSPIGMALVDIEGKYIEVNERLCEIFEYSNQELKSLTFQEITYFEDLEIDLANKRDLDLGIISHFSSEKRFVAKSNTIIWTYMSVAIQKNNKNEVYYIVQVVDINERKKIKLQNKLLTEENNKNKTIQLNEAKNMYRFLAENSVDLICIHGLDLKLQYVSPSVINILGYMPEEMKGKALMDFAHPDDLHFMQNGCKDFLQGDIIENITARYRTSAGNYIWLETKGNIVEENGVKIGFQSSSRDITSRKEEEEIVKKTLAKERELNELRSNLVSTVSREFRTPMTTIRTSAELIAIYLEGQTFEKKHV
jgi:PAS domain S-box-containing protein